ncbi:MAG: VanZ family protein [Elusimicrobia bacterium]|nr:VanZ family protein [Candidatus Obscuribacterium magneticum]
MIWLSSWGPVLLWAGLIFYLSSVPRLTTGWGLWDLLLRKGAHMFEYAVLALFLVRAGRKTWPTSVRPNVLLWSLFGAVLYAASDEIHQAYVPGRGPSVVDVLIDSSGALIAVIWCRKKWDAINEFFKY